MSALHTKADINRRDWDVRLEPTADMDAGIHHGVTTTMAAQGEDPFRR
jgi:hypothetical protein